MTDEIKTDDRPLDPGKLLRLANLVREVLEEVRQRTPADATAVDLAALYSRVEKQLHEALPKELVEELEAIDLDFSFKDNATSEEIRVAYSGLLGWLGGLFQGLQASTAARAVQLLDAAKEPGAIPGQEAPGVTDPKSEEPEGYL